MELERRGQVTMADELRPWCAACAGDDAKTFGMTAVGLGCVETRGDF